MESVYRTLVLRYDLFHLPPEKVSAFLKIQEEFRRWATEWAKGGGKEPLPRDNPLRHFAHRFIYAGKMLDWFRGVKKIGVYKMRPPLIFNTQLRLGSEKDISSGVFVDIPKRVVKIRKWSGRRGETIVLPLGDKAVEWILARVREGGRLTLAAAWVGASRANRAAKLYVALIFRREVAPMEAKRLLVVDFNALHNGVAWAIIEGERIITKGIMKPNVSKILHLQKAASKLDSACAERDKICSSAMATKRRVWRLLRSWEDEVTKKLGHLALQYRAAVIVDVPRDSSVRALKESGYSPERKALLNFGRLRRRLKGLVEWYGISYREERLYSTMCPHCERKMRELPNRRVKCQCGFETHRDEVPFHWAIKRFSELTSFFNSSFSPSAAAVGVLIFKLMCFVSS